MTTEEMFELKKLKEAIVEQRQHHELLMGMVRRDKTRSERYEIKIGELDFVLDLIDIWLGESVETLT